MESQTPILPIRMKQWLVAHPLEALILLLWIAIVVGFYGFFTGFSAGSRMSVLAILESSWNTETDYGHGYLVGPMIAGLLIWRFWNQSAGPRDDKAWIGLGVVVLGLLIWVFSYRVLQWRVAVGSLAFLIWGTLWYLFGTRAARLTVLPIFLICLAVPMPGLLQATNGLQVIATKLGYLGSKLFAVECIQTGTNIQSAVAGKWGFDIAEGCSGIRSLMAMVLIAAVYVYMIELPMWRKFLVFVAAIPLAIMVNAIRIVTILVLAEYVSKDFAAGIYHDYASFFIFPLGLIGMLAVHQILTLDRRKHKVIRRITGPVATEAAR